MNYLFTAIANYLIRLALRTPYYHLIHPADGAVYMERYWLVPFTNLAEPGCWIAKWWHEPSVWLLQKLGIAVRVHHICTPDLDRSLHDHPWNWVSVVLRGGYTEARPMQLNPCFAGVQRSLFDDDTMDADAPFFEADEEISHLVYRTFGSLAFRNATDRHRIVDVRPDTWTLFITGPKVQWWGFYTPAGKVHYRDYESVHNKGAIQ